MNRIRMPAARASALAVLAALGACSSSAAPDAASPVPAPMPAASAPRTHADAPGIDWYPGTVESAFAAAGQAHKPILLYWGALWCPPCQQLKSTVFSRSDFIAKSRLFLPVYLDGDDPGAQKWGEQFRVTGYPTVVVLDPQRHELMRIAGGMDLEQYATVLDTALDDLQPADALLAAAAGGQALDRAQCRRLALNGWELTEPEPAFYARLAPQLALAATRCPAAARVERARLVIYAAGFAARGAAAALKGEQRPDAALLRHVAAVDAVMKDERTAVEAADALQILDDSFFLAVKGSGAGADAWLAHFLRVMDAAASEPNFAEADQLGAIGSKLEALKIIQGAIPKGVASAAGARVAAAVAERQIPYVRSGIINAVLPIYDALGQNEQAYRVVQGELTKTATPYYYKADLGELAEGLGRRDEALKWYGEGYAEAIGPATRFQWGALYAGSLLRLQPDDTARILGVTSQVLGELDGPDRIYRRARMRLDRLDKALRKWNEATHGAHHAVIVTLRERMQQICVKVPPGESARATCDAFLASA